MKWGSVWFKVVNLEKERKMRKFSPRFSNSQGIELGSERRRDGLEGLWSGVFSLLLLLSFVRVLLWLARMVPENDGIEILLRCSSLLIYLKR